MLREPLIKAEFGTGRIFHLRGREVSRIEALSDGVFALAMTLLIVSVEVPNSFDDLVNVIRGFPAFALCFATLMWFWCNHYAFYRRYALNDATTFVLNSVLLFLILFYVYPLKFLFGIFVAGLTGNGPGTALLSGSQVGPLFAIYSAGFTLIWGVFAVMYLHAYRRRAALGLSPMEMLHTRAHAGNCIALALVGVVSIAIALLAHGSWVTFAGWIYFVIGPCEGIHGASVGRRSRMLSDRLGPAATQSADQPTGTAHPPPG